MYVVELDTIADDFAGELVTRVHEQAVANKVGSIRLFYFLVKLTIPFLRNLQLMPYDGHVKTVLGPLNYPNQTHLDLSTAIKSSSTLILTSSDHRYFPL